MFTAKVAIVVRDDRQSWQKLNVTAFVTRGIVGRGPEDAEVAGLALREDKKLVDRITKGARMHP